MDSATKKCAGAAHGCRAAILGILGTELRSNCACRGTDSAPLYKCLGWQRLLWVNPCVGEYEARKKARTPMRTRSLEINFLILLGLPTSIIAVHGICQLSSVRLLCVLHCVERSISFFRAVFSTSFVLACSFQLTIGNGYPQLKWIKSL